MKNKINNIKKKKKNMLSKAKHKITRVIYGYLASKFSINDYLAGNIGIRGLLHISSIVIGGLSVIPNQLFGEGHISQ